MNLVIAIKREGEAPVRVVDTGLQGEVIFNTQRVREEFIVPIRDTMTAEEVSRMVARRICAEDPDAR
jgi:hypothetical protein